MNSARKREEIAALIWRAVMSEDDGCIIWPGFVNRTAPRWGRSDYPKLMLNGRTVGVHQLVFKLRHGRPPLGGQVRHSCDICMCINQRHLLEGAPADNSADMVARGRQAKGSGHGMAKIDEQAVAEMRRLWRDGWLQKEIAALFGIAQTNVSLIVRRRRWRHVA